MLKAIGIACVGLLLLVVPRQVDNRMSKYKQVEVYEARPGILVMPSYSTNGQMCEIGIQRKYYSPLAIRLDTSLTPNEIDQVFEEIVPVVYRGPLSKNLPGTMFIEGGHSVTTITEYENVVITTYGQESIEATHNAVVTPNIVAVLRWKNQKCR